MTITPLIKLLEQIREREGEIEVTLPAARKERPITRVDVLQGRVETPRKQRLERHAAKMRSQARVQGRPSVHPARIGRRPDMLVDTYEIPSGSSEARVTDAAGVVSGEVASAASEQSLTSGSA